MTIRRSVKCGDCGFPLVQGNGDASQSRTPCPNCGSLAQQVSLEIQESVQVREQLKGKVKNPSFTRGKRVRREFEVGSDPRRSHGDFVYKERDIDRDRDLYRELIRDERTGEILHHVEEPLSMHRGHGTAKPAGGSAKGAAPDAEEDAGAGRKGEELGPADPGTP